MSGLRIVHLAEVPEHVPALARAHVAAFGALLPDWSVAEAEPNCARTCAKPRVTRPGWRWRASSGWAR